MTIRILKTIIILLVMMLFQGCIPSEPPPTPTWTYIPTLMPTRTYIPTPMPTWTYLPTQMPDELREKIRDEYLSAAEPLINEWDELILLINDRSRHEWYDTLLQLKDTRDRFANLVIDPFFDDPHSRMIMHMDCQITSYLVTITTKDYQKFNAEVDIEASLNKCVLPGSDD